MKRRFDMGSVLMKHKMDRSVEQMALQFVITSNINGLKSISEVYDLKKIMFKDHSTLLHVAAFHGCEESVKYLLDIGMDPNVRDVALATPLHYCVSEEVDSIECLKILLQKKADINARNVWLRTPLIKAIVNFKYSCAEYLIKEGADVNFCDKFGTTALHVCASYGNYDLMELLLQNRASVSVEDTKGRTPIHFAIVGNHAEIFHKLLTQGSYESSEGSELNLEQTVQLVISKLNVEMLHALLMAGASVRNPPIEFCLKIVQKCVKGTDSEAEASDENVQKVHNSIQCMKMFIAANGFPIPKSIRDKVGHLMNGCTNLVVLKSLNNLMEVLANIVEPKMGTPDTLQNLSRRKCRCSLMLGNRNVLWATSKLEVSPLAIDLCTLKM